MRLDPASATTVVMPGAEPFFFPGGKTGCLLVHGFTGTPREMHEMGEHLASAGHSVLGIRLSGHATRPQDLFHVRWRDWMGDVESGVELLRGCSDSTVVMGLSMGGMLALIAGARLAVAGVVALSTPYRLRQEWFARLRPFMPAASLILPFVGKGQADWRDGVVAHDHLEYPHYPLCTVAELFDLLAEMRRCLTSVRVPVLLINSRSDETVTPDQAEEIAVRLRGPVGRLMVADSGHVVTRDASRLEVFRAAADFARRTMPA